MSLNSFSRNQKIINSSEQIIRRFNRPQMITLRTWEELVKYNKTHRPDRAYLEDMMDEMENKGEVEVEE